MEKILECFRGGCLVFAEIYVFVWMGDVGNLVTLISFLIMVIGFFSLLGIFA